MKKVLLVFVINVIYVGILLLTPSSKWYHVWEHEDVIEYYSENISTDTGSYANMPPGDTLRTVGYPLLLKLFMLSDNFPLWMLLFNCFLGAWMFFVVYQLIGYGAWILAFLGAFTIHVPMILTDLLFAAIFVTAIWQVKKRLWLHFLLLGIASLVRPSLAWFFVIEPAVLYFNGYRGRIIWLSLIITFLVTSFNPLRNYVNHGRWTHSTVLEYNIENRYGETEYPKYLFLIDTFKTNCLDGHPAYLHKSFYDNGNVIGILALLINFVLIIINIIIWMGFSSRVIRGDVNWGNLLMVAYFIGPSLFGSAGARIRLPIEWILLM